MPGKDEKKIHGYCRKCKNKEYDKRRKYCPYCGERLFKVYHMGITPYSSQEF